MEETIKKWGTGVAGVAAKAATTDGGTGHLIRANIALFSVLNLEEQSLQDMPG